MEGESEESRVKRQGALSLLARSLDWHSGWLVNAALHSQAFSGYRIFAVPASQLDGGAGGAGRGIDRGGAEGGGDDDDDDDDDEEREEERYGGGSRRGLGGGGGGGSSASNPRGVYGFKNKYGYEETLCWRQRWKEAAEDCMQRCVPWLCVDPEEGGRRQHRRRRKDRMRDKDLRKLGGGAYASGGASEARLRRAAAGIVTAWNGSSGSSGSGGGSGTSSSGGGNSSSSGGGSSSSSSGASSSSSSGGASSSGIGGPHGYARVCVVATVADGDEEGSNDGGGSGGARRAAGDQGGSGGGSGGGSVGGSGVTMSSLLAAGVVDPKAYVNFSASPGDGNVHLLPGACVYPSTHLSLSLSLSVCASI